MTLIWQGFVFKRNLFHSDEKFQLKPCRTSTYSHYFPSISFILRILKRSPITLATGRQNPWKSGCECLCTVSKQKNDRPQLLSDSGLLKGVVHFGKPRHGDRWQYAVDTRADLVPWLSHLQPLMMPVPLQLSWNLFHPQWTLESLPHVFFVTKHFLCLFAFALKKKITISTQITKKKCTRIPIEKWAKDSNKPFLKTNFL